MPKSYLEDDVWNEIKRPVEMHREEHNVREDKREVIRSVTDVLSVSYKIFSLYTLKIMDQPS